MTAIEYGLRVCWNRQTGTFEGRVSTDVWVQVPLLAPLNLILLGEIFCKKACVPKYAGCLFIACQKAFSSWG